MSRQFSLTNPQARRAESSETDSIQVDSVSAITQGVVVERRPVSRAGPLNHGQFGHDSQAGFITQIDPAVLHLLKWRRQQTA